MKSLKTLSFKGDGTISPRDLTIILRTYPPTLESLEIDYPNIYVDRVVALWDLYSDGPTDWERYDDPTNSWRLLAWFWSGAPQSSIRRLVLPRCDGYPEKICPVLLLFLKHRGGKLAHFKLPNMEPAPRPKDLITALSRCPEIRHLEFESITREMLLLYPAAIQACRSLESLTVSGSVFDARGVIQALVDHHASTIKRIRWTGGGGFEGGLDLELFLKTCPNLERLETSHGSLVSYTGQGASGSMWIKNIPLPSTPDLMQWICWANLTYLDITFYVDRNIVDEQQFRDQIELTYKKLGQLTALEELHLGCECRCIGPQLQYCDHSQLARPPSSVSTASMFQQIEAQAKNDLCSPSSPAETGQHGVNNNIDKRKMYDVRQPNDGAILDLSLATGLAHLAGLKKLRTLNISRIKGHKIGYPELEWMRDNWPQLTTFKGLRDTALWRWVHTNWIVAPSASQHVE
ncbi:hypothetical protein BGZ98_000959 [Dissophora globulifera]|nr:hypothetical protein BGZ98_000959 [Dissophora globulifera]